MKFLIEKLNKKGEVEKSEEIEVYNRDEAVRIVLDRSNLRIVQVEEPAQEETPPEPKVEVVQNELKGGDKN